MKYAIVYTSKTGNTAQLAGCIKQSLPAEDLLYCGVPAPQALAADLIFAGFWTDKGSCDDTFAAFLKSLESKAVFLFGSAGFGGSESYFGQILGRVQQNLDASVTVAGRYMCQGKMPLSVRQRYEAMRVEQPEKMTALIENFDRALVHPSQEDLAGLQQAVASCLTAK